MFLNALLWTMLKSYFHISIQHSLCPLSILLLLTNICSINPPAFNFLVRSTSSDVNWLMHTARLLSSPIQENHSVFTISTLIIKISPLILLKIAGRKAKMMDLPYPVGKATNTSFPDICKKAKIAPICLGFSLFMPIWQAISSTNLYWEFDSLMLGSLSISLSTKSAIATGYSGLGVFTELHAKTA